MPHSAPPDFDRDRYARHVAGVAATWREAMLNAGFDAAVIPAGASAYRFQDDLAPPFRANPNFAQWAPLAQAEHGVLLYRPPHRPRLFFYQPADFWHLPPAVPEWAEAEFDLEVHPELTDLAEAVFGHLKDGERTVLVGEAGAADGNAPFDAVNPPDLVDALHYARARKDDFELDAMRRATELGVRGHLAARDAYFDGASELDIHLAFLRASRQTEAELPYPNIVAQNTHAGVLHYQLYDAAPPGLRRSFLIDAGGRYLGYASDITRTYSAARDAFADLVDALDAAQRALIDEVQPGVTYPHLHERMHRVVARLLHEFGLVSCSPDAAFESGITDAFFPHGLGHLLGLQTHDVGGHLADAHGTPAPPPERFPALRLTRTVEAGHVFTVEPGIYFIPLLLDPLRVEAAGADVVWSRVDEFLPCGGIRIEDNVAVTADGTENLTRDAFARLERHA
ncbi:MAG: Xaa-Pro dipeptidase [Gammaproteobacteria bacterium]|nr:Xaa-Pro dipeptidase [Gammaproteobacteria bacterium]